LVHSVRVLHIIKSLGRGGAEMLLAETLRLHDTKRYHFQFVYFLPWKNQMVSALEAQGVEVICLSANSNVKMLMKVPGVVRLLKREKIEVVHAHLPWAGFVARIACKVAGVPLVYTEHNKQERYHWATRLLNKMTFGWQQQVIAVSNDVQQSIFQYIGRRTAVATILNGIDTNKFVRNEAVSFALRSQLGIDQSDLVVGTMAVFRKQKRLDIWLTVFATLRKQYPGLHGVVVGDGPLMQELADLAQSLQLHECLHFVGLQTDNVAWLSVMDVFMMTSDFEGLPLALLEAMSCQCAVVSTKAGGIVEVVSHGEDGWLCELGDTTQLENFTSSLIEDEGLRQVMGEKARQKVQQHYSLTQMVRALEDVYENVK
jgi:L-malate glycosyltransferase